MGEDEAILTFAYFSDGLVKNHQPEICLNKSRVGCSMCHPPDNLLCWYWCWLASHLVSCEAMSKEDWFLGGEGSYSVNTMVFWAWIILTLHKKVWKYILQYRLYMPIITVYIYNTYIFMYRFKLWHFLPNKPTPDTRPFRIFVYRASQSFVETGNLYWGFKHSCEFTVDHNFIPRIIGKGGDTIRALREKYDAPLHQLKVRIGHSRVDQWLDCNLWRSSWFRSLVNSFLAFCYHFTCH